MTGRLQQLAIAAIALGTVLLTMAQETALLKPDDLKKPEVVRGRQVFQQNCAACHGPNATGGMGPNLLTSEVVRHDTNGDEVGRLVHDGRMDKGMPAFPQIPAVDVTAIAAFLHARVAAVSRASALSGSSVNTSSLLTGNAATGQQAFAAKCATCHNPTGDLKGIATRLAPQDLMIAMLMPKSGKETGSVTPKGQTTAIQGTFLHRDQFTVTLRKADGSTATWQTKDAAVHVDDPLKAHRDLLPTYTDKETHDLLAYLETLR